MTNENLEQKVGLMERFRSVAGKGIGAYVLASALALGGAALGGCEGDDDNTESCTPVHYEDGYFNCGSQESCYCSKPKGASNDDCSCSCVHVDKTY